MIRRIILLEDDPVSTLHRCQTALRENQVIVFPTDTVYGLLAHHASQTGFNAILKLKNRSADKPLSLLSASDNAVTQSIKSLLKGDVAACDKFSTGLLTCVVEKKQLAPGSLPDIIDEIQPGTIGIRCPCHEPLQHLLKACGGLCWATSANASGMPPPADEVEMRAALNKLRGKPEIVVLSHAPGSGRASSIAMISHEGNVQYTIR